MISTSNLLLLNNIVEHICESSTFIRVFLEPSLDELQWETNLAKRRLLANQFKEERGLFSDVIGNEYLITVVINFTATIAGSFSFKFSSYLSPSFKVVIIIAAVACWICFSWFFGLRMKGLKRGEKIEEGYWKAWTNTKEQL